MIIIRNDSVYTQSSTESSGGGVNGDEEPNFEYIPVDASPASKQRVRTGDRLFESIMLLAEGLETGAVTLQFDVSSLSLIDSLLFRMGEDKTRRRGGEGETEGDGGL